MTDRQTFLDEEDKENQLKETTKTGKKTKTKTKPLYRKIEVNSIDEALRQMNEKKLDVVAVVPGLGISIIYRNTSKRKR